jgi:hypothetical protein
MVLAFPSIVTILETWVFICSAVRFSAHHSGLAPFIEPLLPVLTTASHTADHTVSVLTFAVFLETFSQLLSFFHSWGFSSTCLLVLHGNTSWASFPWLGLCFTVTQSLVVGSSHMLCSFPRTHYPHLWIQFIMMLDIYIFVRTFLWLLDSLI